MCIGILFCSRSLTSLGWRDVRAMLAVWSENTMIARQVDGAIQITTASGICGVLDLMAEGKLPQRGFIKQEDVSFDDFINNRFGRYYQRQQQQRASAA